MECLKRVRWACTYTCSSVQFRAKEEKRERKFSRFRLVAHDQDLEKISTKLSEVFQNS